MIRFRFSLIKCISNWTNNIWRRVSVILFGYFTRRFVCRTFIFGLAKIEARSVVYLVFHRKLILSFMLYIAQWNFYSTQRWNICFYNDWLNNSTCEFFNENIIPEYFVHINNKGMFIISSFIWRIIRWNSMYNILTNNYQRLKFSNEMLLHNKAF